MDDICLGGFSNGAFYLRRNPGLGGSNLVIRQRGGEVALDINGIHAVECLARAMEFDEPTSGEVARWQKDIDEALRKS